MKQKDIAAALVTFTIDVLKNEQEPWSKLKENRQKQIIRNAQTKADELIAAMIDLIGDEHPTMRGKLAKIDIGDKLKLVCECPDGQEDRFKIFDHNHKPVLITAVPSVDEFNDPASMPQADPDQPEMAIPEPMTDGEWNELTADDINEAFEEFEKDFDDALHEAIDETLSETFEDENPEEME